MSAWIIGIVGVICLGVLLDIIVPEGETNKYIKGIFSIVTIVAIVSPLPKLINSDFDIGNFFSEQAVYQVDDAYLENLEKQLKQQNLEKAAAAINECGVNNSSITVVYSASDALEIAEIKVNMAYASFPQGITNNDIVLKIKAALNSAMKIKSDKVSVYGFRNQSS